MADLPARRESLSPRRVPDPWPVETPLAGRRPAELPVDELSPIEREIALMHAGPVAHRSNLFGLTRRADQAQPLRTYQDPYRRRSRAEFVANLRASGSLAVWIVSGTLFVAVMLIALAIVARAYSVAVWIAP